MEWYEYAFKVPGRRNRYSSVLVTANSKLEAITKAREAFPEILKAGTDWLCYSEAEGDAVKDLRKWSDIKKSQGRM